MKLLFSLSLFLMLSWCVKPQKYIIERTSKLTLGLNNVSDSSINVQILGGYEDDFGTLKGYSFFVSNEKVKVVSQMISDFCQSEFEFEGVKVEADQIEIFAYGYKEAYTNIVRTYENMFLSELLELVESNKGVDLFLISRMSFELDGEKHIIRDLLVFSPPQHLAK